MYRHRLAPEADYYRLPEPPAPNVRPGSFVLCSVAVIPSCTADQWTGLQLVYGLAFDQARAVSRPSILDRNVFTFWN
jgi:hypothetical protein